MQRLVCKRGFTLIELISIIVILSIIISISTILFLNIRKSVLQKEYDNLVNYLETKAEEYTTDTNITTVSVEDLIKSGYVSADDQSDVYDPRNNTSMNCNLIYVDYIDGKFEAELKYDVGRKSDGTCNKYNKTTYISICKFDDDNNCSKIDNDFWFNSNIKLGVKFKDQIINKESNATVKWTSNNGYVSDQVYTIETNVLNFGEITYTCEVTINDLIGSAVQLVKIDKDSPIINDINVDNSSWSTSRDVKVSAVDNGSGIKGYSIVSSGNDCTNYQESNILNVAYNGKYKLCVKDYAENVSTGEVEISKIDEKKPTIVANNDENQIIVGTDNNVLDTYFTVNYSDSLGVTECNYKKTGDLEIGEYTLKCTLTAGTGEKVSASTKLKVKSTAPAIPVVQTRYSNSSGKTYNGSWTNSNVYFSLAPGTSSDNVTSYQYKVGNGSWNKTTSSYFTYSKEVDNIIYVRACDGDNCGDQTSGSTIKIDKTSPTCSLMASSSTISFASKSNDVESYGINKSQTSTVYTTTQSLSTGTFYGHVTDKAGNTAICSLVVKDATPTYKKKTVTCEREVSSYDCVKSASTTSTCPSGYASNGTKCYKSSSATEITTYTLKTKTCKKTEKTTSTSYKSCASLSKSKCNTISSCSWKGTGNNATCLGTYCESGYKKSGTKCIKTTTTYSFTSETSKTGVTGCTLNKFSCSASHEGDVYRDCSNKKTSYTCTGGATLKGTLCYTYKSYTTGYTCSKGIINGSSCYLYDEDSCPSGFSIHKKYYTYYDESSTSTDTSCSEESSFKCNSSHYGDSYVSKCSITGYKCSSGYTLVGTKYCYK